MKKKQLVICDSNEAYAHKLQDYWMREKCMPCRLEFYTDWNKFKEYISGQSPGVCIVSEDLLQEPKEEAELLKYADKILLLCEEKEGIPKNGVYRYQDAVTLAKQICQLSELGINRLDGAKMTQTKLIGVYTPIGRCLQTSFTLVLGQMLAAKHKVLYLNFESFSGFSQMMQRNFNADMADLLYFLKNLSQDFSQQFTGMKQTINGLDYIPPAFSYIDISRVLPSEWEHFFEELEKMQEYEYILLDLTDYVQGLYQILRSCSHVYTITRNDGMALAKLSHYEDVLKELAYEDVLEKTKKCSFPIYRQLPMSVEELMYSELADYTRRILKEDFEF